MEHLSYTELLWAINFIYSGIVALIRLILYLLGVG